jgi:Lrp/AsnC family leucine-responsive transcriptional regulator
MMLSRGIIKGFSAVIDPEKVGLPTIAIVLVKRAHKGGQNVKSENLGESLAKLPEVQEVYLVTGEHDAIIKIRGTNERDIGKWVVDKLWNMPDVERTLTLFAFYKSKESHALYLK